MGLCLWLYYSSPCSKRSFQKFLDLSAFWSVSVGTCLPLSHQTSHNTVRENKNENKKRDFLYEKRGTLSNFSFIHILYISVECSKKKYYFILISSLRNFRKCSNCYLILRQKVWSMQEKKRKKWYFDFWPQNEAD